MYANKYSSSTATQNTEDIMQNYPDQYIIGIEIVTTGSSPSINVTQFMVNMSGTTDLSDISNVRIYYTGTTNEFSATNQFGSDIASPGYPDVAVSGTQTLETGTNYFWLTVDMAPSATTGNVVDAECTMLTVDGVSHTPIVTAPSGERTIINFANAYSNYQNASLVIGQPDFTTQNTTIDAETTYGASCSAISSKGVLAVGALNSKRVMLWNSIPTANGEAANIVIGKTNFTDATTDIAPNITKKIYSVAFSPDGNKLLVSDPSYNRVLIWNSIPTTNGANADVVIGQEDFISSEGDTSATKLREPAGIIVTPDGKLLINEKNNHRILVYNLIPTTNGAAADVVIGQTDMTSAETGTAANRFGGDTWYSALTPDGRLVVSDTWNHRILIFNSIPTSNNASADVVIGQTNFTDNTFGTSSSKLYYPVGVTVSSDGKLAIADYSNHRVLIFNEVPTSNGASADIVLGQPDFTSGEEFAGGSINDQTMSYPYGINFDLNGRLFVNGEGMDRVMVFGDLPSATSELQLDFVQEVTEPCLSTPVEYTLTITNNGPDDAANVYVNAALPEGFTLQETEASTGTTYNSSGGLWEIPELSNETSVTLNFTGTIDTDQGGNIITAYANIVSSDEYDTDLENNAASLEVNVNNNNAPTISTISDQVISANSSTGDISFTIEDFETATTDLDVSGNSSSDEIVSSTSGFSFGGSGTNRTVDITPETNISGSTQITITVSDGVCYTESEFNLTIGNYWLGNTNDWNDAANWSGNAVPAEYDNVVIPTSPTGGLFPTTNSGSNAEVNDLEIQASAYTYIPAGKGLTVNGTLTNNAGTSGIVIRSNSTEDSGTGSLIHNTDYVQATVMQSLDQDHIRYVSAPISDATSSIYSTSQNNRVYRYEEGTGWTNIGNGGTALDIMEGYVIQSTSDIIISFTGTLNNGTYTSDVLTNSGTDGFNLLGNPYPSAINWGSTYGWTKTNLESSIWFRTANNTFTTCGLVECTPYVSQGPVIPPMQAFWVRALSGGGQLEVNNLAREHSTKGLYKSGSSYTTLRIKIADESNSDEMLIYFIEGASNEYDDYDSHKKFSSDTTIPQIYTTISGHDEEIVINGLEPLEETVSIPIGVKTGSAREYTLTAFDFSDINPDVSIYLEDLYEGERINLRKQSSYTFTSEAVKDDDRFMISFDSEMFITDIYDNESELIDIYSHDNYVFVRTNSNDYNDGTIYIYNLLGQEIANDDIKSSFTKICINQPTGYYVVRVRSNQKTITGKVFIK